jgi:glycosyltransferase involved in cell wall biosynthesis
MPVVLAAPPVDDGVDPLLEAAIPADVPVYREYGGARRQRQARRATEDAASEPAAEPKETSPGPVNRAWGSIKGALKLNAYFTPFDRYLVDVPAAIDAGKRLIQEHGIEAIYACGDPFSCFYTGVALKRATGLPLILDLRDPWALHDGKMALRPWLSAQGVRALERSVFEAADKVILNTEACLDRYLEHYGADSPEGHFTAIRNSYDPSLFLDVEPEPFDRFTVLYFGTLRRFVALDEFLAGFRGFIDRTTLSPEDVQVVVMGEVDQHSFEVAEGFGLEDYLQSRPPVSLRESMKYLKAADLLLLVIQDSCTLQIPGKLYDYLASGTPIFAVSSNAEANGIIESAGAGVAVDGHTPDAVAAALTRCYEENQADDLVTADTTAYTAQVAAQAMATLLNDLTQGE